MTIQEILGLTIKNFASDLHLLVGIAPVVRIDGALVYLSSQQPLGKEDVETMVFSMLTSEQKELLLTNKELDFGYDFLDANQKKLGRFRINAYFQKGNLAAAFRFLPIQIRTIEELNLPKIMHSFANLEQGLVLVCGPTGHGKSTTLASIINEINMTTSAHILTVEDPIEYIYPLGKSIISQREIGFDTHSWDAALRSSLRDDPDVVLIGEMRDPETISSAISIAETGHIVFSTLHTNSASQSIDRMVDAFPSHQQNQIRSQLSATLKGIVSQRLLPQISGGMVPAVEVLLGTSAVASNIRDGKTHLIDSVIQTSGEQGMITLESSLAQLVSSGAITLEKASAFAIHPEELLRQVG